MTGPHAHALGPELTLTEPEPSAPAAAAQLRPEVRPQSGSLQVVVDENVIQSIQSPRLDRERPTAHAGLDQWHRLLANGVQERTPATQDTRDG